MAVAYAVFQYQTAGLEIYSNLQAHSKIDLAARKWPGADSEEAFAWKQTQIDLHRVKGRKEVFFRSGKIDNKQDFEGKLILPTCLGAIKQKQMSSV